MLQVNPWTFHGVLHHCEIPFMLHYTCISENKFGLWLKPWKRNAFSLLHSNWQFKTCVYLLHWVCRLTYVSMWRNLEMLNYVRLGSTLHTVLPNFGYFMIWPSQFYDLQIRQILTYLGKVKLVTLFAKVIRNDMILN